MELGTGKYRGGDSISRLKPGGGSMQIPVRYKRKIRLVQVDGEPREFKMIVKRFKVRKKRG